ncbi:transcriptional regulator [Pseudomonas sp. NY5710]|uniref:histone-like nucleoid-structuring protein, MvaT/MvaU family n=1 Tax=Pseudomonas sp. NY5710 TaxID=2662033 RepID=UPI00156F75A5|nr:histone-like nucleoid-structuring protein, MvaT/MvaU family [Pseudomonas sp. NY5710]QKL02477.1 transcriptional regulator [Pseudomonas sp. NY5710]
MSHLAQFRALEWLLANKKDELQFIKVDPQLRRELEFESKLHDLLAEYQFGLRQVLSIMAPEQRHTFDLFTWQPHALVSPTGFRARLSKFYQNPYTGEVVEAKSTLHKTLRQWIKQYSRAEVESWVLPGALLPRSLRE